MRDPTIELDVQLRRASAMRMSHDEDTAVELARRVRARAAERGDAAMELRATLELGQALLRSPLGESFGGAAIEVDLDGSQGDRSIEFLAAGGVAMSVLDLGDVAGAERWIGLAAAAASLAPSRTRARQLETWRGMARAGAGDVEGMRRHLEKAVAIATEGGRASARCEALARLAVEAARLVAAGASGGVVGGAPDGGPDPALVELVERSAAQVKELLPLLQGHAPWGAQADAALATVALARGDIPAAVMAGGAALQALQAGLHEDASLEIVVPAARAVFAGAPPEMQGFVRGFLQSTPVQDCAGHRRRGDPRPMAHRAHRPRARGACRPDGGAGDLSRRAGVRGAHGRPQPRRRRAPAAAAPDPGPDERRDRGRARRWRE